MSPDPNQPFDPEEIPYFFDNWCGLPWSPWVPFNADKQMFRQIPHEPGLYRIRPAGRDFLMYIGVTGRTLHLRLNDLRQSLRRADLMPWADPLPEAPALWSWWKEWISAAPPAGLPGHSPENEDQEDEDQPADHAPGDEDQEHDALPEGTGPVMLECSAASLDASAAGRRGMESFLLYRYRQERGESPLCNFGRFHPRYRKSTIRKGGLRGGRLAEDQLDNPAGFPGIGPLAVIGKPGDRDWMGLEWTGPEPLAPENAAGVPAGAGLYLLSDAGSHEIVYIGQSEDVAKRLPGYTRKSPGERTLEFSYQIIGQSVVPHNLRELKTDLIGNFFENFRKAPEFQFKNTKGPSEP